MSRLLFRYHRKNDNADNGKSRLNWWQTPATRAKDLIQPLPSFRKQGLFHFFNLAWFLSPLRPYQKIAQQSPPISNS